jgi:hypothetical protein
MAYEFPVELDVPSQTLLLPRLEHGPQLMPIYRITNKDSCGAKALK